MIDYLPCYDPCVVFLCLIFCIVSPSTVLQLTCAGERDFRAHALSIKLPCIPVSQRAFVVALGLKPIFCEGTLKDRNLRELTSNNVKAVGPNHAQLYTSNEDETEQKTRP